MEKEVDSVELPDLQYNLRLHLHATSAKLVSATIVADAQSSALFERRSGRLIQVDAWINPVNLPPRNANLGWTIPTEGIKIPVGKLVLNDGNSKLHRYILCRVGIGRPFYATEEVASSSNVPEGYDSFILPSSEADQDVTYYWIKDPSQLLRRFTITFEYDANLEMRSREKPICENCEQVEATLFSTLFRANLCSSCAAETHSTGRKLAAKHPLLPIGEDPVSFGCCRNHVDRELEFFCPLCRTPVCVLCKMIGHHSTTEASSHRLILISEAYQDAIQNFNKKEASILSRRAALEHHEQRLSARAQAVTQNVEDVRHYMELLYQRALQHLDELAAQKLTVLRSDALEVQRQKKWLDRLESFLHYQKGGHDGGSLLFSLENHQNQLQSALNQSNLRETIDVVADIKCEGSLIVAVDSSHSNENDAAVMASPAKSVTSSSSAAPKTPTSAKTTAHTNTPGKFSAKKPTGGIKISPY